MTLVPGNSPSPAVRMALFQKRKPDALGISGLSSGKRQSVRQAKVQPVQENILRQLLADENQLAFTRTIFPFLDQVRTHQLLYPLENNLVVSSFDIQDAFITQHIRAKPADYIIEKQVELLGVEWPETAEYK